MSNATNSPPSNCTFVDTQLPDLFLCDCIDTGDTSFMIMATTFVFLQTPFAGLAQAGAIRRKNALSMIMQTLTAVVIGSCLWVMFGFSLTFGPSQNGMLGTLDFGMLLNIPPNSCFPFAPTIPSQVYVAFQMMFALMTPFIVTGSWAEKMNFVPFLIFITLWPILVYYPLAHWIWNVNGWMTHLGPYHNYTVRDFAGGMTIHTSTGVAGLVVSLFMQSNKESASLGHHNLPLNIIGGVIVWGAWYSFNGGSAFVASSQSAQALLNTHVSACTGAASWVFLSRVREHHKWHLTEIMNGGLAGLAGITAASGFVTVQSAFVIGLITGTLSWLSVRLIKDVLKINDVLDVTSLQGVPGIVGSIMVGFCLQPAEFNGSLDPAAIGLVYGGNGFLIGIQLVGVCVAIVWSAFNTSLIMLLFIALDRFKYIQFQLSVSAHVEEIGLDMAQIGEQAYDDKLAIELDLGEEVAIGMLNQSCASGNLQMVRKLVLKDLISPRLVDYDGRTPLHLAVYNNQLLIVKFLIEESNVPVNINAEDNFGINPLADALDMSRRLAVDGQIHTSAELMVKYLVLHGALPSTLIFYDFMKLCTKPKNYSLVRLYLLAAVDVNKGDYDDRTPLMIANSYGCGEIVQLLLENGASRTQVDRWGNCFDTHEEEELLMPSPSLSQLHQLSVTKLGRPLPKGARIAKLRKDIVTEVVRMQRAKAHELCLAAASGNAEEVRRLLKKGEDPSHGDYDERTPLHMAAAGGHLDIVKLLCKQRNVNINHLDRWRHTPLQEAIHKYVATDDNVRLLTRSGHNVVADYLKIHGGFLIKTREGVMLCYLASVNDLDGIMELRRHGQDINMADYDGRTCLHIAACYGHVPILEWLLALPECNPHPIDRFKNTPLDDAQREHQTAVAEILQKMYEARPALSSFTHSTDGTNGTDTTHSPIQDSTRSEHQAKSKELRRPDDVNHDLAVMITSDTSSEHSASDEHAWGMVHM